MMGIYNLAFLWTSLFWGIIWSKEWQEGSHII